LIACTLVTGSLLAGCESLQRTDTLLGAITPYRIDIVQGNAVTREQAALIKPGMNRLQVREILGTPLVTDPFHADRWDYIFSLRRPNTQIQRRSVVVMFENNLVKSITAPDLPSERDFVASISRIKDPRAPKLELSDDERKALPLPPKREARWPSPWARCAPTRRWKQAESCSRSPSPEPAAAWAACWLRPCWPRPMPSWQRRWTVPAALRWARTRAPLPAATRA
jgi:outer membrane protein assembly factor BamE